MFHRLRTNLVTVVALALLALFTSPAYAQTQEYTFTPLLDSSQGLISNGCAAINDSGAVAFTAFDELGTEFIIRAAPDGTLTTVADTTKRFNFFGINPSINNAGQVSFAASLEKGGEAIVVSKGKSLKTVADTSGDFNFFGFNTSLNNQGEVVFTAELDEEFGFDEGTFVANGKVRTVYLASTSQFIGVDTRRSINDAGQIAFQESLDDTVTPGLFFFDGSNFVTIVDETSPLVSLAIDPQVNNVGTVVFTAFQDDGQPGIMTWNGGQLSVVADTTGAFFDFGFFGGPAINDSNVIAFNATLDTGESGVFTASGTTINQVIGTGDTLSGSTVTGTFICSEGLNNAGQLAFVVFLEDGRSLVVRATPTA